MTKVNPTFTIAISSRVNDAAAIRKEHGSDRRSELESTKRFELKNLMGYIDAVNPFTLTINELAERWATNKTQEILDRTAEFCDKDCTKEVAMLTLRAWYDCEDLRSAARHLGAGVDVQPPDALTLIVNTVFAAQNIDTHLDDGETCDDPSCVCHDDCEIQECLVCNEREQDRAEDAMDAARDEEMGL